MTIKMEMDKNTWNELFELVLMRIGTTNQLIIDSEEIGNDTSIWDKEMEKLETLKKKLIDAQSEAYRNEFLTV